VPDFLQISLLSSRCSFQLNMLYLMSIKCEILHAINFSNVTDNSARTTLQCAFYLVNKNINCSLILTTDWYILSFILSLSVVFLTRTNVLWIWNRRKLLHMRLVNAASALIRQQHFSEWNDVMTAILNVWRHVKNFHLKNNPAKFHLIKFEKIKR